MTRRTGVMYHGVITYDGLESLRDGEVPAWAMIVAGYADRGEMPSDYSLEQFRDYRDRLRGVRLHARELRAVA